MGLLDDLLGSLAEQTTGARSPQAPPTRPAAGGADMSKVLMALLPLVLAMLSNRRSQADTESDVGFAPSASGGGLIDILGQVLGGAAGRGGEGGGLGGLIGQLQRAGFGAEAESWVSRGQNRPLPPDAMSKVFGRDGLREIARRTGFAEDDVARGLSQLLPAVVDRVTPSGEVPDLDSLAAGVDALARRLDRS